MVINNINKYFPVFVWVLSFSSMYIELGESTPGSDKLNEFIEHYERLVYDTDHLQTAHLRAKRSLDKKPDVTLQFHAHDRAFKLRLRRDAFIFSDDADLEVSGKIRPVETSHIYSGHLDGVPDSRVYGSIISGVFAGTIHTPEEVYYVEKSETFFKNHQPFHSIIYKDSDVTDAHLRRKRAIGGASCGNSDPEILKKMEEIQNSAIPNTEKEKPKRVITLEENWRYKYSLEAQEYYNTMTHSSRTKRAINDSLRRTCTLYLEADPMLWKYMTGKDGKDLGYDRDRALDEITSLFAIHVNGIKAIYNPVVFQYGNSPAYSGFNFVVRRVKINTDEDCEESKRTTNPYCKPNIDVSNFLNLNSLKNHDLFCLAYVFTYRDFSGGTLGLAWVGSSTKASGGICERHKEYNEHNRPISKSLNTGIVTLVNYGTRVPPKVSTLTFAHEIGHNFGSPHDSGSCVPTSINTNDPAGNYIMFASATSGDHTNNNRFSPCSIHNMTLVIDAVLNQQNGKVNCFVANEEAFCGNAILEEGEVCDCGFKADCDKTDQCCFPQEHPKKCTLESNASCSPSQGPCCQKDCKVIKRERNIQCRQKTECSHEAHCKYPFICTGTICEVIGWKQCYMTDTTKDQKADKGKLCYVACQNPSSNECISTGDKEALKEPKNVQLKDMLKNLSLTDIKLQPGAPCDNFKGYCDVFQKCRSVDADGPLARLKKLLFNKETLMSIKDWIIEKWWAVTLIAVGIVVFMGIFIKVCAVHTPSSNPKKPPARKISLKQLPRSRHQGPPPGYPASHLRAGPPHGKGRGPGGSGRPPPYSPHSAVYEMSEVPPRV
ncbi:hypothetical protein LSH36_559g00017 [Paralvinella palmiformis]|uniref:ADAM10 endopeptidase n=1 Tax=Paralvinella palmiformis TaxID=53620 RepID=A0AAD9MVH5_9ANNE|nr:hypothetical protein LSH36_559g00017 [Paralvinella palmiformis]